MFWPGRPASPMRNRRWTMSMIATTPTAGAPHASGPQRSAGPVPRRMTFGTLGHFFAIAFGLGWGVAALMVLFSAQIEALFGPIGYTNPVFILVVYSPAISGLALVWRHDGVAGLGRYLRRLALWRMPGGWWTFLLL